MTGTFDTLASFSMRETETWLRMFCESSGQFLRGLWPQLVTAGDIEALAAEIEQVRVQLRNEAAEHNASVSATAARFDHLRDELAAERDRANAGFRSVRDELARATAAAPNASERLAPEVERLRAEIHSLREEMHLALKEKEAKAATAAAALKDLRSELRAVHDRIDSLPASAGGGKGDSPRKPARR
jgi:uncharacterized coiled-coil DUF342 family protein